MKALGLFVVGLGTLFASFSHSTNYSLNSYGVGPGGTSNSASTTYRAQATVGEQANGVANSTTYTAKNGSIQTEQLNVPGAPTLSNGGGTYYNQLNCIVNNTGLPSDATYAIAVSSNNFSTTSYVQANQTLGGSPVFQTYTAWGGSSGALILGLSSSTTYEVKVSAKQGQFTNTEYGAYASASTVSGASISFSVSPNSSTLSTLLPGTIVTSSNVSFTFATNGASGGYIYVSGAHGGLYSPTKGYTIPAYSGNLSGQSQGEGIQATSPSQTSGGPFTAVSPYNGTGNTVGAEPTTLAPFLTSAAAITGGTATANVQVKANSSAPPSNDYNEVFTFLASASF